VPGAVGEGVFIDKLFDRADAHRLGWSVQDAIAFTKPLLRADARADFGHVAGGTADFRRAQEIAVRGEGEPLRNPICQGTTGAAARLWALDATTGLGLDRDFIVQRIDLMKIRNAIRRGTLWRIAAIDLAPRALGSLRRRFWHSPTGSVKSGSHTLRILPKPGCFLRRQSKKC